VRNRFWTLGALWAGMTASAADVRHAPNVLKELISPEAMKIMM
jgi:hypothetical protein